MLAERVKPIIVSSKDLKGEFVEDYWKALFEAGTLQHRFGHIESPSWADAVFMMTDPRYLMFSVLDGGKIVAEFALENFTGKAAQIHFSMHPDNHSLYSFNLCVDVIQELLNTWEDSDGQPYLHSLFGITPIPNKVACRFIQKCGFERLGILPSGTKHLGEVCDALLTVMTRK